MFGMELLLSSSTFSVSQTVLNLLVSTVSVAAIVYSLYRWKISGIVKANSFKITTDNYIQSLTKSLEDLCTRMKNLEDKIEDKIAQSDLEHEKMRKDHYELVKELYTLIGKMKRD